MRAPVRRAANWINLTTPLGLLVCGLSGARPRGAPDGHYLATGYRWPFPLAGAFTIGDVVLTRAARASADPISPLDPGVWRHEVRHSEQYAWCAGLPFLPAYGAAVLWSYLLTGDWWTENMFEQRAGLAAGGYVSSPRRAWVRRFQG